MVAPAFDPNTEEAEAVGSECEARLVYRASFRSTQDTEREFVSKKEKEKEQKNEKKERKRKKGND